ncbi:MAG: type I-E CRISPR-associated protein Cse2/CasB, partial [Methanoregula sp.]
MEQKHYLTFTNPDTRDVLLGWWRTLDLARGDRAELRRCHSPLNVAFTPSYHRLRVALMKYGSVKNEDLALVAGVLAHVKINTPGSFPLQLAGAGSSDAKKAALSGLRFRRILAIDDRDKLFE